MFLLDICWSSLGQANDPWKEKKEDMSPVMIQISFGAVKKI